MIDVRYTVQDPVTRREGILRIAGGVWTGDACGFEFADTLYGLSGTAMCDWREPTSRLWVDDGTPDDPGARALLDKITTLLLPFHRSAFRQVDLDGLQRLYAADYHTTMNYAVESPIEAMWKSNVIDQMLRLCSPKKVLDAGCSAGEVVRQLRQRGIEAWGFDLSPDLARIAYRDVAPWLRQGRVDQIPFGPEDGFDTLVALDVFEHVPEQQIGPMVSEFARLGVRRVVAHIAMCEFQYPGHVTLRPLSWWDRQLAPWFHRTASEHAAAVVAGFGADPSRFLRVYELAVVPAHA